MKANMWLSKLKSGLSYMLFPKRCLSCQETVENTPLCKSCEQKRKSGFILRKIDLGLKGDEEKELLIVSAVDYKGGLRKSFHRFKFSGKRGLANQMAELMTAALEASEIELDDDFVFAFVPMTLAKERERGYNQSELLARECAARTGKKSQKLLSKIKENKLQHEMELAERKKNVLDTFAAENCKGKRIILVDDVITSGSTMGECARQLYKADAEEVVGLCFATTVVWENEKLNN